MFFFRKRWWEEQNWFQWWVIDICCVSKKWCFLIMILNKYTTEGRNEDLSHSITEKKNKFFEETQTVPQDISEFKVTKPMDTISSNITSWLGVRERILELTTSQLSNSVMKITIGKIKKQLLWKQREAMFLRSFRKMIGKNLFQKLNNMKQQDQLSMMKWKKLSLMVEKEEKKTSFKRWRVSIFYN